MAMPSWPAEQENELRRLLGLNRPIREIAAILGRTPNAVRSKRRVIGKAPRANWQQRVERMVYLTERVSRCRQYLNWRNTAQ